MGWHGEKSDYREQAGFLFSLGFIQPQHTRWTGKVLPALIKEKKCLRWAPTGNQTFWGKKVITKYSTQSGSHSSRNSYEEACDLSLGRTGTQVRYFPRSPVLHTVGMLPLIKWKQQRRAWDVGLCVGTKVTTWSIYSCKEATEEPSLLFVGFLSPRTNLPLLVKISASQMSFHTNTLCLALGGPFQGLR